MNISLITINYNSADTTLRLIRSLLEQTDTDFHLRVIDNASGVHDIETLIQEFPKNSRFILERMPQNLGFSGGNNHGIRSSIESGAEWIVLLNNDTVVRNDFISLLRANLSHSEGIIGLPLQEGEKTALCGQIKWLRLSLPHLYENSQLKTDYLERYAIGAGMAIQKSVFEKIGYLDKRYFLYFEDADFSARAWGAGIPVSIAPFTAIHHTVSSTTRHLGTPLLLRYHARNALLFNWKNAPMAIKIALPFISLFAILYEVLKIAALPKKRADNKAILYGIFDFYSGKFGKISS